MSVRFYVDADLLGLAHVLVMARSDVTFPGDQGGRNRDGSTRPACPVTEPRTKDPVWVPLVAAAGWVIITKDKKIQRRPAELAAVRESGARMVALSGARASTVWGQLRIVTRYWDEIEKLALQPGPLIRRATHLRMTSVVIPAASGSTAVVIARPEPEDSTRAPPSRPRKRPPHLAQPNQTLPGFDP